MTNPAYTSVVLQIASDAAYSAQGDAYDGTITKPATTPALALITQGSRPQRQMAARLRNWIDAQVAGILGGLITDVTFAQGNVDPSPNGTRLSVMSGQAIPTADVVGATTLYLARQTSLSLWLFDATNGWTLRSAVATSLVLSGLTTGSVYDVFAYWDGAAVQLELGAAWVNATTPNSLVVTSGVRVKNSGTFSRRYVGSIQATGATTTEDSASKRFVNNADNKVRRHLLVSDATASWALAQTTFRQVHGSTANKVEVLVRDPAQIDAFATILGTAGASGIRPIVGIGVDSVTVNSGTTFGDASSSSFATETNQTRCEYDGILAGGYHAINWLEALSSATSTTIFGTAGGSVSNLRAHVTI